MIGSLHRLIYRAAHALRHRWRVWRGTRLEGVTMIARDLEGRVLMVRLSYGTAAWSLPGGGARRGESMHDAAVRELAEETGCEARNTRLVGQLEEVLSGSPHTAHVFTCLTEDSPRADGREVVEARFFPTHSLPHPVTALTKARLDLWRASDRPTTAG